MNRSIRAGLLVAVAVGCSHSTAPPPARSVRAASAVAPAAADPAATVDIEKDAAWPTITDLELDVASTISAAGHGDAPVDTAIKHVADDAAKLRQATDALVGRFPGARCARRARLAAIAVTADLDGQGFVDDLSVFGAARRECHVPDPVGYPQPRRDPTAQPVAFRGTLRAWPNASVRPSITGIAGTARYRIALLTSSDRGFVAVIDMLHPDTPLVQPAVRLGTTFDAITLVDDRVYVAGSSLRTFTLLADGTLSRSRLDTELDHGATDVLATGELLVVAMAPNELRVLSDRDDVVTEVASLELPALPRFLARSDAKLVVGYSDGFSLVDITQPAHPKLVTTVRPAGLSPRAAVLDGDVVYIANNAPAAGLVIYRGTDAIAKLPLEDGARGVAKIGHVLYVASHDGVHPIDVTDPARPRVGAAVGRHQASDAVLVVEPALPGRLWTLTLDAGLSLLDLR